MAYRVGSATSFVSDSQTTTSFSINSPVGVQDGDIVKIMVYQYNSSVVHSSSGFTFGNNENGNGINQGPKYDITWMEKVASGEPGSYTVTCGATFAYTIAMCAAWTGRNTSAPITDNAMTAAAGSNSPVTFSLTGVTAALADDLVCAAFALGSATCVWTPPAGFTAGLAVQTPSSYYNGYFAYQDNVSAGATGTIAIIETGVATDQLGFVVALAAGASPGIVVPWLRA